MEKKKIVKEIKEEIKEEVVEEPKEEKKSEPKGVELLAIKTAFYPRYAEILKQKSVRNKVTGYIVRDDELEVTEEMAKELIELGVCKRV